MLFPHLSLASGAGPHHTRFWFVLAALTTPLWSALPPLAGGAFACLLWTAALTSASSGKAPAARQRATVPAALEPEPVQQPPRQAQRRHKRPLWSDDDGFTLSGPRRA